MLKEETEKVQNVERSPAAILCVGFVFDGKPVAESSELLAGSPSRTIQHSGEEYRLEKTRNGKLILKK